MNIQESFSNIIRGKSEINEEFRSSLTSLLSTNELKPAVKEEVAANSETVTENENMDINTDANLNSDNNSESNSDEMEEGLLGAVVDNATGEALTSND